MRIRVGVLKNLILAEAKLARGERRISWDDAEVLAYNIAYDLDLGWVDPAGITIDTRWQRGMAYPVGSIRRQKADIGDIDMIVTSPVSRADVEELEGVSNVTGGTKQINFTYTDPESGMSRKVNLFVFLDPKTFGAALMHGTGPGFYNVRLRHVAGSKGFKLSQNGLVDSKGRVIAGPTERSIQDALGVSNREPTER
jgi:DNA polymerase/3'-5' exonuclease PolX